MSTFLFAVLMDRLTDEVRLESLWNMLFVDNIVICERSREQVEESLERWRNALERRGMRINRDKTEYLCLNGPAAGSSVKLQGVELAKMDEFKYLGSMVQENGKCEKRGEEMDSGRLE